jgi:cystathionine beta-synthase
MSLKLSKERRVFDTLVGAIGNTPLVRLSHITEGLDCSLYAKLEMLNPGGSVKDRIAFGIIEAYEASGQLEPGGTVIEATSGNTGVGLAIACALKGYEAVFVMPDKMSQEKIDMLRAYGARVVIAPTAVAPDDPRSYYSVARRLVAETPGAVLANQYHNPANPASHEQVTGPEIWAQTEGQVTDIVIGMGTGGTITGIARFMRAQDAGVRIVGVDPVGSILYDAWRAGGDAAGLEASGYLVEGIGEDFVPTTLDLSLVDEVIQVTDAESFAWARRLVREEGIFAGGSCGAALAGAMKYAKPLPSDRNVVVILPDSGSRYLSKLFDDRWMREHGFDVGDDRRPTVSEVARSRGLPKLITAHVSDPLEQVIAQMREFAVSQLPVLGEEGRLVGLVSEVDLLNHLLSAEPSELSIESLIEGDVPSIRDNSDFRDVLPELLERKVIVLTNEDNRPTGILTMIDALEYISTQGRG